MKIIAFLMVLLLPAILQAESKNPDKYPSIGVHYGVQRLTGDSELFSSGFSASHDIRSVTGLLSIDGRIPLNDNFTLGLGFVFIGTETTANETPALAGQKAEASGSQFSVGFRYYFIR